MNDYLQMINFSRAKRNYDVMASTAKKAAKKAASQVNQLTPEELARDFPKLAAKLNIPKINENSLHSFEELLSKAKSMSKTNKTLLSAIENIEKRGIQGNNQINSDMVEFLKDYINAVNKSNPSQKAVLDKVLKTVTDSLKDAVYEIPKYNANGIVHPRIIIFDTMLKNGATTIEAEAFDKMLFKGTSDFPQSVGGLISFRAQRGVGAKSFLKTIRNAFPRVAEYAGWGYKKVDDIAKYIKEARLDFNHAEKFEKIKLERLAEQGERVETILADGTHEFAHDLAEAGDYIVRNVNGPERWVIKKATFEKKYEPTNVEKIFKPKGGPMKAAQINEGIVFKPPKWGGAEMTLDEGGYILQDPSDLKDIYGVAEDVFERTYKFID